MTLAKSILIVIGYYIVIVVVADIAGVLLNTLFDIFAGRSKSTLLYYTVWFVTAIFAGMLYFGLASSTVKVNETFAKNNWIITLIAIILSMILFFIFYANGQMDETNTYYVPGNPYMTYTFFVTFILASIFAQYLDKPYLPNKKIKEV